MSPVRRQARKRATLRVVHENVNVGVRNSTNNLVGEDTEAKMGVAMQNASFGFADSGALEGGRRGVRRAGAVRERVAGCNLAIKGLHDQGGRALHDARLDLITRLWIDTVEHRTDADPNATVHRGFDSAIRLLERASAAA